MKVFITILVLFLFSCTSRKNSVPKKVNNCDTFTRHFTENVSSDWKKDSSATLSLRVKYLNLLEDAVFEKLDKECFLRILGPPNLVDNKSGKYCYKINAVKGERRSWFYITLNKKEIITHSGYFIE